MAGRRPEGDHGQQITAVQSHPRPLFAVVQARTHPRLAAGRSLDRRVARPVGEVLALTGWTMLADEPGFLAG